MKGTQHLMENNTDIFSNPVLPINELYPCIQGEGPLSGRPHLLIRLSGCKLRCQFGNSFCDTWYLSWRPEKGKFTLSDVEEFIKSHPHIHYVMITGGGPTSHPKLLEILVNLSHKYLKLVTVETEGSEPYIGSERIDYLSLSPKLSSSTPVLGSVKPWDNTTVTQKDIDRHEKYRTSYTSMKSLKDSSDFSYLKPVISSKDDIKEIQYIQELLVIPNSYVYLMPCGVTSRQLDELSRYIIEELCIKEGYNYTDRLHVRIYGEKRGV